MINLLQGVTAKKHKIYKAILILTIFLAIFLFFKVGDANAEKGYGWMVPGINMLSGCASPLGDVRIYVTDSVSGTFINANSIKARRAGIPGTFTSSGSLFLTVPCWDPALGIWVDEVAEPGYRKFQGGVKLTAAAATSSEGRIRVLVVALVRNSGSCRDACPTIETVSPASPGARTWFPGNPPSWVVRARLLPIAYLGSTAVDDWLLDLQGPSPFFGWLDLGTNGGATWAAGRNSMTPHNITAAVNAKIGSLDTGIYSYTIWQSANGSAAAGAMDPDSGYPDFDDFGVDRVNPISVDAWHVKPGYSCNPGTSPTIYEDESYRICANGRDEDSGSRRILIWVKVTQSAAAPVYNLFLDLYNSCTDSTPGTVTYPCFTGPLRSSPPAIDPATGLRNYVHYRACVIDQVNRQRCTVDDYFNPQIVEPWLETEGPTYDRWSAGNIGAKHMIIQRRSFTSSPNPAIPTNAANCDNYTGIYSIINRFTQTRVKSCKGWEVESYTFNMDKFPAPVSNSIYTGLWNKYRTRCSGTQTVGALNGPVISSAVSAAIASRGCNIVVYNGGPTVDINSSSWPYTGPPGIVFLPNANNLRIRREVRIANNTGLIFVVDGNINVCKYFSCGDSGPVSQRIDEIDGFYISDGWFRTDNSGTSTPEDPPLAINGSVISFGTSEGVDWRMGSIVGGYGRSINSAWNRNNPSEIIRYQPKYLWLFRETLGDSVSVFEEVAP